MKKKVLFGVLGATLLAGVVVAIVSSIKKDDEDDFFDDLDDLDDLDCYEGYDPEIADDFDKRVNNIHKSQGLDDANFDRFDDLATEKEALSEG